MKKALVVLSALLACGALFAQGQKESTATTPAPAGVPGYDDALVSAAPRVKQDVYNGIKRTERGP